MMATTMAATTPMAMKGPLIQSVDTKFMGGNLHLHYGYLHLGSFSNDIFTKGITIGLLSNADMGSDETQISVGE